MFIETQNGGHLGFYEGGIIYPNPLTWLDRILVSLLGGIAFAHNEISMKKQTQMLWKIFCVKKSNFFLKIFATPVTE